MFGGPYELGICVDAVCDCAAPAEEPSRSWHILNASMSQLPAAAGDSCMLSKPVCGAGALLLEHDATQIAIAIVTTNREMQDPVIIGFRSWIQAAVDATAAASVLVRISRSTLRHLRTSSLRAM